MEDTLPAYCQALSAGWGVDEEQVLADHTQLFRQNNRRHHFFLARIDEEPVAAASYVLHQVSAYLVGAVVLPPFRGRGLYRTLIRARLQDIQERYQVATVTTHARGHTSAPILERLGFTAMLKYRVFAG